MAGFVIALSVLGLILLIGPISFFVFSWIKRLQSKTLKMMQSELEGEEIYNLRGCNFFGLLSSGAGQLRGNGLLALTSGGLRFRMLLPPRRLDIPLEAIEEISYPEWFLGKTKTKELLRVDFKDEKGNRDAAAWLISDPQGWGEAVKALREDRRP
ncbi:MAG: hypothetical protein A2Y75_09265 [Candidatus Solincola sediminis]|uniref:GRAM domain-containing protein n=1 Tax=Candidatus Solincola sediminis TaxID=1797199 RepID=A0A1F2WF78_9ACTN|nr:MAG: hypothetical protein A2Y75_09265 [Candidatus Solincola sediminis]